MSVICKTTPPVSPTVVWAGWALLREGLDRFLNGEGITKWNLLFHQGGGSQTLVHCQDWIKELITYQHTLPGSYHSHLRKYLEETSGPVRLDQMARMLSALHLTLGLLLVKGAQSKSQEVHISGTPQFSMLDQWRRTRFFEFLNASQALAPFCLGYYLHGSAGEGNMTTSYSDVDTLMVISDETMKHPEALLNLRTITIYLLRYLYAIDPLQHHGHLVMTQGELSCYREEYLPLNLWREAVPILGPRRVTICIGEPLPHYGSFNGMLHASQTWARDGFPQDDLYRLKAATSLVQLFPAVYTQATGRFITKRDAFAIAQSEFPSELWDPIRRATQIREAWPPIPWVFKILRPALWRMSSPWTLYYAGRLLYRRVSPHLHHLLQHDFAESFRRLVEFGISLSASRKQRHARPSTL